MVLQPRLMPLEHQDEEGAANCSAAVPPTSPRRHGMLPLSRTSSSGAELPGSTRHRVLDHVVIQGMGC